MKGRLSRLDEARGYTLISMILYHFMWDLKYLAGMKMDWYTGFAGTIWQQSICISFILISGFSFSLGKNHFKRSIIVFMAGCLVSAVTLILMPENRIVFGILTFMGSAGLLMIPISRLHDKLEDRFDKRTLNLSLIIWSMVLFVVFYKINDGYLNILYHDIQLPKYLFKGYIASYLGFRDPLFYSTDYFSILPWLFIYMCGFYIYRLLCIKPSENDFKTDEMSLVLNENVRAFLSKENCRQVAFIGRNTLLIYMLHQPVLYLITLLVKQFYFP